MTTSAGTKEALVEYLAQAYPDDPVLGQVADLLRRYWPILRALEGIDQFDFAGDGASDCRVDYFAEPSRPIEVKVEVTLLAGGGKAWR